MSELKELKGRKSDEIPILSFKEDKISMAINILNSIQVSGIQQAQAIIQLATILTNPIK